MVTRPEALALLRQATGGAAQDFMPGQWRAIDRLANERRRVLLVQRTGWGKSMVYFLTTKILRDAGSGPTLILSPLLALMRNQVEAARHLGLRAETINTTNSDEWNTIIARVRANQVDLLLVSPERLSNERFMEDCLRPIAGQIHFLAVDEAHCISDWGHDFRPDYQRIDRILRQLPANVAVLATTATANDRVVADVQAQLGEGTLLLRGPLARSTLRLQATSIPNRAERLAWLVDAIPQLPGSGIVYTLTVRDAVRVTAWLVENDISARVYHGKLADPDEEGGEQVGREELENLLLRNEIKVLVATNALGMGFDKPDLGFVIHFQAPQSIVHYYQQVGRAGRAIDDAVGILLGGDEDDEINDFFIETACPPRRQITSSLAARAGADDGLSVPNLLERVNLRTGQIEKVLKLLAVGHPAPVIKQGTKWYRTANPFQLDEDKIRRLRDQRRVEAQEVQTYIETDGCLMAFLTRALDDPETAPCGKCANCVGEPVVDVSPGRRAIAGAARFIRQSEVALEPRKRWQANAFPTYGWRGNIPPDLRCETGKALALWRDAGWGDLIESGKEDGRFSDELVEACAEMIETRWGPEPDPTWVTCVPSLRSADLVPDFSARLARRLGLPFRPAVVKVRETERQRIMMNSYQQASNLDGAFAVREDLIQDGPVLLIDDIADSRWSLAVIGALLRQFGSGPVHPCVLALASGSSG
jgi:ATP-dependent DNA helicase RecQ